MINQKVVTLITPTRLTNRNSDRVFFFFLNLVNSFGRWVIPSTVIILTSMVKLYLIFFYLKNYI